MISIIIKNPIWLSHQSKKGMFEGTYFGKNTFIEKESLFIFSDTLKEKFFKGLKTAKIPLFKMR